MSAAHEERIKEIHKQYNEKISYYIVQYELICNEFPIEILNEIRATFSHLSKYYLSNDDKVKDRNLTKAESHIKRATLDCFKYICLAYEDKYIEFENIYKGVDLSLVDNGEFLPKLLKTRNDAIALMLDARKSDLLINSDSETDSNEAVNSAYDKYEKAFIKYSSLYDLVNDSYKKVEIIRKRALKKDILSISGWIIGVLGIIVSIISLVF